MSRKKNKVKMENKELFLGIVFGIAVILISICIVSNPFMIGALLGALGLLLFMVLFVIFFSKGDKQNDN